MERVAKYESAQAVNSEDFRTPKLPPPLLLPGIEPATFPGHESGDLPLSYTLARGKRAERLLEVRGVPRLNQLSVTRVQFSSVAGPIGSSAAYVG